jgi:ectoine hydroxylase-related dioxygenase (phytanoyl-CoA dioxygenase family)
MRIIQTDEIEQKLKELKIYGYTVVSDYLDSDSVEKLLTLTNQLYDPKNHKVFQGRPERELDDKMVYNLQNKDKVYIDLLSESFLTKILTENLNDPFYKHIPPEEPNYILSFYNARSSGPKLDLHTDTFVPSPGEKTWLMQAAFVLEDSSVENGCTILVPGSHISGKFVDRKLVKLEYIEVKAGALVIWDSRIWHGTTENTTKKSRWSLIATFSTWWVKQRSDMTRSLPEEIYKSLTDNQKVLLGFCSIPPKNETERLNFKGGYKELLPSVADYYR